MKESTIKKVLALVKEQQRALVQPPVEAPVVDKKPTVVVFDKGQEGEFKALFSERGFSINGTRLSFESIEDAISKNYIITLDSGQGLVLDAVRMQKILKYKDRI